MKIKRWTKINKGCENKNIKYSVVFLYIDKKNKDLNIYK